MLDSIMSALGYVGDALDKPGRAVRGVLAGKPQELAAAIPFSDSLGITDPANRTSGRELLSSLGASTGNDLLDGGLGFAAEIATDPTTYLGGFAGRMLGKAADAAQVARGPRYATTADDLGAKILGSGNDQGILNLRGWGADENIDAFRRAARDVPPNSEFLGAGVEGVAFKSPSGDVYRVGLQDGGRAGRPVADSILQPSLTADTNFSRKGLNWDDNGNFLGEITEPRAFRVERTPFADRVGDKQFWRTRDPETMLTQMDVLRSQSKGAGLPITDPHYGNVGVVGGSPKVIDPGAVDASAFAGDFAPVIGRAEPGVGMDLLLRALGGDAALQRSLESGVMSPGLANKLTAYGALAGAAPGRFGGG